MIHRFSCLILVELSFYLSVLILLVRPSFASSSENSYVIIGVSGGLQDGFPSRSRLDFNPGLPDESKAIFVGRALVHGYKAYLDLVEEGWIQYRPEPDQPSMFSHVFASGCHEHANQYWIYIVDSRAFWDVLAGEPRFLSITPDTGQLDLTAVETDDVVRRFFRHQIQSKHKGNMDAVAIPLVTAVWFNPHSHIPSPAIHIKEDGTQVTNYSGSLALWAGVDDKDRNAMTEYYKTNPLAETCQPGDACYDILEKDPLFREAKEAVERYWDGLRKSIRQAEEDRSSKRMMSKKKQFEEADTPPYQCQSYTRFGVDEDTLRVNYIFTQTEIQQSFRSFDFDLDFERGEVVVIGRNKKEKVVDHEKKEEL